jgi:hypothetical protein
MRHSRKPHHSVFIPLGEPQAHGDTAKQAAEKFIVVKGTAFRPYINHITNRPLGPEGTVSRPKNSPQWLKPVPFVRQVSPQPVKLCPSFTAILCTRPQTAADNDRGVCTSCRQTRNNGTSNHVFSPCTLPRASPQQRSRCPIMDAVFREWTFHTHFFM